MLRDVCARILWLSRMGSMHEHVCAFDVQWQGVRGFWLVSKVWNAGVNIYIILCCCAHVPGTAAAESPSCLRTSPTLAFCKHMVCFPCTCVCVCVCSLLCITHRCEHPQPTVPGVCHVCPSSC